MYNPTVTEIKIHLLHITFFRSVLKNDHWHSRQLFLLTILLNELLFHIIEEVRKIMNSCSPHPYSFTTEESLLGHRKTEMNWGKKNCQRSIAKRQWQVVLLDNWTASVYIIEAFSTSVTVTSRDTDNGEKGINHSIDFRHHDQFTGIQTMGRHAQYRHFPLRS